MASTLLAVASVAVAALATSSGVGRKTLGGRGFATDVTVSFTAPDGYSIDGGGYENWKGPLYSSLTTGSNDLESNLHFDVHSDPKARTAEQAARNKVGKDMGGLPTRQVAAGPIAVPHLVAGRKVGVVRGYYVLMQVTQEDYEGWYESGLGLPLGKGYPLLAADVDATAPAADADKRIQGTLPSVWNRRVVLEGIRGIAVEGNLAPGVLTAAVRGRRVTGRALDTLRHPLVRARIVLRGPGGKRCCGTLTAPTGAFALTVPPSAGSGAFQISVAVGSATLTKSIRVG